MAFAEKCECLVAFVVVWRVAIGFAGSREEDDDVAREARGLPRLRQMVLSCKGDAWGLDDRALARPWKREWCLGSDQQLSQW